MTTGGSPAGYRELAHVREFTWVLSAHAISLFGDMVAAIALTVLVFDQSESAFLAACAFSLTFLPHLFAGGLVGAVVTKVPPKRALVGANAFSAVLVVAASLPALPTWALLPLMFAVGVLGSVIAGVRAATLPEILPAGRLYLLGKGTVRVVSQGGQVLGYAAGGVLLAVLAPRQVLLGDALSFVVAAIILSLGVRGRPVLSPPPTGAVSAAPVSVRSILRVPRVRQLLLIGWIAPCFAIAPEALAAAYVDELGLEVRSLGLLLAAGPAAMVLADVLCSRLAPRTVQRVLVVPGAILLSAPLIVFFAGPGLWLATAVMFVCGLGLAYNPGLDDLIVERTPHEIVSRVLALQHVALLGLQGVAVGVWGLLGEVVRPGTAIAVAGLGGVVVLLFLGRDLQPQLVEQRLDLDDRGMG